MSASGPRHSNALLIAWRLAELEAANLCAQTLEPEHFFLGLLKLPELPIQELLSERTALGEEEIQSEVGWVRRLDQCFRAARLNTTRTRRRIRRSLNPSEEEDPPKRFRRSTRMREVFSEADVVASNHGEEVLEPTHLLAALLNSEIPEVETALYSEGCSTVSLKGVVNAILKSEDSDSSESGAANEAKRIRSPGKESSRNAGMIEAIGRDLTELAKRGKLPPVIGRKAEMKSVVQVLLRSRKNNVILTGEPGVGKTGLVEGLAQRIVRGEVPEEFRGKRIVEISMGALMAGTNLRGDLEARLQSLIAESERNPDLILFIDEIHLLVGAGRGGGSAMDAANILKPALARNEVRVIGATTTREFRRMLESDPALARRFEAVEVGEPTAAETLEILQGLRPGLEAHHHVAIDDEALTTAIELTNRHLPLLKQPDKAIDTLDQSCARARLLTLSGDLKEILNQGVRITGKDVASAVAHRCNVPVSEIAGDNAQHLVDLESRLASRVFGQSEAVHSVSKAIRIARSGLKSSDSPLASFLFAGPSGVGKTELAKALADTLFGPGRGLVRVDMSEFMESHSVSKMIGSPPGFIGHEEGGHLTEQIRTSPSCVLLLDEVEKAHPRILDLFLQVLDTGFLTDSHGTRVDFRHAIIAMTTNLGGSTKGRARIGFQDPSGTMVDATQVDDDFRKELKGFFRAEFINRITAILQFRELDRSALRQVLQHQISELNRRLQSKEASLKLTQEAEEELVNRMIVNPGGGRSVHQLVQDHIISPLSKQFLTKTDGAWTFLVEFTTPPNELRISARPDE